ncbi:hypothetical protein D3C86_1479710 [compost metagenome]
MTESSSATSATFGMPKELDVANVASVSGGLMRRPRFDQMAMDCTMKLMESVAMIGGMRRSLINV